MQGREAGSIGSIDMSAGFEQRSESIGHCAVIAPPCLITQSVQWRRTIKIRCVDIRAVFKQPSCDTAVCGSWWRRGEQFQLDQLAGNGSSTAAVIERFLHHAAPAL